VIERLADEENKTRSRRRKMNRILKRVLKILDDGTPVYAWEEEIITDMDHNSVTANKKQAIFNCPSCGQPLEQRNVRENCPQCKGVCCDFCHEQRARLSKLEFERMVILEKESVRLLENKIFDGIPGMKFVRQLHGINTLKRLKTERRKIKGE
jgi:Zn finger protein HypA/HybF involved in hydrogenase expression